MRRTNHGYDMPPDGVYIVSAAILYQGQLYPGFSGLERHADIMKRVWADHGIVKITQDMQGFITSSHLFVNRALAADIAYKAGQLTIHFKPEELRTEHLW